MSEVFISGIFSIRNAFEVQYPFIEAILSILPAVDEMLIADGFSNDGTWEYLKKLQKVFPEKIKLYRFIEKPAKHYENMDNELNILMEKAKGKWIWQIQADEGYHEKDLKRIIEILEKDPGDAILQPRLDIFHWERIGSYIYKTNRIIKRGRYKWIFGGDDLWDEEHGYYTKKTGYYIDIPFYHFQDCFPNQQWKRTLRHINWLGKEQEDRKRIYEQMVKRKELTKEWRPPKKVLDIIPEIFKPLAYMKRYRVRKELFDREYLRSIYSDML